jgi:hypothetical protein
MGYYSRKAPHCQHIGDRQDEEVYALWMATHDDDGNNTGDTDRLQAVAEAHDGIGHHVNAADLCAKGDLSLAREPHSQHPHRPLTDAITLHRLQGATGAIDAV